MFGLIFDLIGIATGVKPSRLEDYRGTYRASSLRFLFLGLSVAFILLSFLLPIFSLISATSTRLLVGAGAAFFLVFVGINLRAFFAWARKEKKQDEEEAEERIQRYEFEKGGVSAEEDNSLNFDIPDWLAKIWDGRVIDDSQKRQ